MLSKPKTQPMFHHTSGKLSEYITICHHTWKYTNNIKDWEKELYSKLCMNRVIYITSILTAKIYVEKANMIQFCDIFVYSPVSVT